MKKFCAAKSLFEQNSNVVLELQNLLNQEYEKCHEYESFSNVVEMHNELEEFIRINRPVIDDTESNVDNISTALDNILKMNEEHRRTNAQFHQFLMSPTNNEVIDKINSVQQKLEDIYGAVMRYGQPILIPREYSSNVTDMYKYAFYYEGESNA